MNIAPLPNRLRVLRAERKMSQSVVAAVLECSASRVSLVENGHYDLTANEKAKLAEHFKCRVSDIFPKKRAA
jgi:DNA-binding XRE family transcriptional regulator